MLTRVFHPCCATFVYAADHLPGIYDLIRQENRHLIGGNEGVQVWFLFFPFSLCSMDSLAHIYADMVTNLESVYA
jgi:hypothetical protein